jgi:hypothetical protein
MSRLFRPYIPLAVRNEVARLQFGLPCFHLGLPTRRFNAKMKELFGGMMPHLDHDPPLGARMKRTMLDGTIVYSPDANDPRHLVYRTAVDHQIKTNVSGEHGQHPDRVLIKKQRRRERPARPKPKRRWPSRPFPKDRPGFASRRNP